MDTINESKVKGGRARAENLSAEERKRIATKAANARWNDELIQAVCGAEDRPLRIGNVEIQCYVLADGTRVLSQAEFLEALGRHRKANVRYEEGEERIPPILQGKAIRPFISNELLEKSRPIRFRTPTGTRASGYRADLLPDVCEIYLRAREIGALPQNQERTAQQAEILIRGLAHIGIIALVDEATGYQEFRAKDALARILEAFIAKELKAWVPTFSGDFYKELFRLRGLKYPTDTIKRPQYFGYLTTDIVYKRLAPGVLSELKRVTPRNESGRLKNKLFQRLTSNVGYPKLREHLGSVVTIMKLSNTWHDFMTKLDRLHPRYGETIPLPLDYEYDESKDDGKGI
jgi:hypothetical protein